MAQELTIDKAVNNHNINDADDVANDNYDDDDGNYNNAANQAVDSLMLTVSMRVAISLKFCKQHV